MEHPFRNGAPSISRLAIEDGALLSGRYWGELRTFLAVAKARSLNRAADELGVSRMTAGREIRRLQDTIGAQLIVFTKTGAAEKLDPNRLIAGLAGAVAIAALGLALWYVFF